MDVELLNSVEKKAEHTLDKVKQLGQYFTPDFVANFMLGLSSKGKNAWVLEPSSGEGVFTNALKKSGFKNYIGCEIDKTLIAPNDTTIKNESFISASFNKQFDLVIGNPPYVRWKNMATAQKDELASNQIWNQYFNSLSDYLYIFILKSVELLQENGELIFITPEYWLSTMHSQTLRNYLIKNGYFTEIYHFSETPIFNKVASSIIIFKYVKTKKIQTPKPQITIYKYSSKTKLAPADLLEINKNPNWNRFTVSQFKQNQSWLLAPKNIQHELLLYEQKCMTRNINYQNPQLVIDDNQPYVRLGDIATIANGLVSGLDKVFQIPENLELNEAEKKATLQVLKAKNMQSFKGNAITPYIYLNDIKLNENDLKKSYNNFYTYLQPHKRDLQDRYNYNKPLNYWDWVFLRSIKLFKTNQQKIFVPCKERITNKNRLRFCLAGESIYPTQDVTAIYVHEKIQEDILYFLALLNSKVTYDWVSYKGLIKGGIAEFSEKPLSEIPIKLIDWANKKEVALYNKIVVSTKQYIAGKGDIATIDKLVLELLQ